MSHAGARLFFAVLVASAGCLAFGAKIDLIRAYGSDVPYMDEWDVVGGLLLIPSAHGDLRARDFLQPQNEHRIILTRLLAYGIAVLDRQWDPLLEMTVNAAIHAALCSWLVLFARRLVTGVRFVVAAVGLSLLFILPFGWENTLQGLQSQYYLLLWGAVGMFLLCVPAAPLGARWWAGLAVGIAGLGTVASGFVAPAVVLLLMGIRSAGARRLGIRETVAALLLASVCAAGILSIRRMPGHAYLGAHSLLEWGVAMADGLSWPAGGWPAAFVILQLPFAVLLLTRLRERRMSRDEEVLAALALWTWAQVAIIAFGRANLGMMRSRYMDFYAIGSAVNMIALAVLLKRGVAGRRAVLIGAAWAAVFCCGLWKLERQTHTFYLDSYKAQKAAERLQVSRFLEQRDPGTLRAAPPKDLPYPDPGTLIALLSDPAVQSKLPVGVRPPVTLAPDAGSRGFQLMPAVEGPVQSGTRAWVAKKGPARFVSRPFSEDSLPFLHVDLSGSADLDSSVFRVESAQDARALDAFALQGALWRGADIAVPRQTPLQVVVTLPPGDHWLAFTEPVELGAGSWLDRWLLRRSRLIALLSLTLFACALAALLASDLARQGEAKRLSPRR
jgi:hypothetical protein